MEKFIQVGVAALRKPDGTYQPAVPLYVKADEQAEAECNQGMAADAAGIFQPMWEQYMRGKTKDIGGAL